MCLWLWRAMCSWLQIHKKCWIPCCWTYQQFLATWHGCWDLNLVPLENQSPLLTTEHCPCWFAFVFSDRLLGVQAVLELAGSSQYTLPRQESTHELEPSWVTVSHPARTRLREQGQVLQANMRESFSYWIALFLLYFLNFYLLWLCAHVHVCQALPVGWWFRSPAWEPQAQGHRTSGPLRVSQLIGGVLEAIHFTPYQHLQSFLERNESSCLCCLVTTHWLSRR